MSPAATISNDEKWNNGYKESDTYIQQTIAFYYRLNKVSTSLIPTLARNSARPTSRSVKLALIAVSSPVSALCQNVQKYDTISGPPARPSFTGWYSRKCNRQASKRIPHKIPSEDRCWDCRMIQTLQLITQ